MISISDLNSALPHYRILVIGRTGTGKSSLCNALLDRDEFTAGWSLFSTTFTAQASETQLSTAAIKVIDTPDVTTFDLSPEQMRKEVSKWRRLAAPHPSAIFYTVRCHMKYTDEERAVYDKLKALWRDDEDFCSRLVVVFTFADCLTDRAENGSGIFQPDIEEKLRQEGENLANVLKDADNRLIVFSKQKTDKKSLTIQLLNTLRQIEANTKPTTEAVQEERRFSLNCPDCTCGPSYYHRITVLLAVLACVSYATSALLWVYVEGDFWPYISVGVSSVILVVLIVFLVMQALEG